MDYLWCCGLRGPTHAPLAWQLLGSAAIWQQIGFLGVCLYGLFAVLPVLWASLLHRFVSLVGPNSFIVAVDFASYVWVV